MTESNNMMEAGRKLAITLCALFSLGGIVSCVSPADPASDSVGSDALTKQENPSGAARSAGGAAISRSAEFESQLLMAEAKRKSSEGKFDEAVIDGREVIKIDPSNVDAHLLLSTQLIVLAEWARTEADRQASLNEAIAVSRRAIELDRNNPFAYALSGLTLSVVGKHDEAIASFRRAIAIDPTQEFFHLGLETVLKHSGRKEDAAPLYNRAKELGLDINSAIGLSQKQKRRADQLESLIH
jgi:tetratricopeptide (TPR) repeat protein